MLLCVYQNTQYTLNYIILPIIIKMKEITHACVFRT